MNVDYLTKDRLETTENNLVPLEEVINKYKDISNEEDIKRDVLKSVIHSSLGCRNRPGRQTLSLALSFSLSLSHTH